MPRENYQATLIVRNLPEGTAALLVRIAKEISLAGCKTENVWAKWDDKTNEAVQVFVWRIAASVTQTQGRNLIVEAAQALCQSSGVPFEYSGVLRRVVRVGEVKGRVQLR